jgi:hypothetical protein
LSRRSLSRRGGGEGGGGKLIFIHCSSGLSETRSLPGIATQGAQRTTRPKHSNAKRRGKKKAQRAGKRAAEEDAAAERGRRQAYLNPWLLCSESGVAAFSDTLFAWHCDAGSTAHHTAQTAQTQQRKAQRKEEGPAGREESGGRRCSGGLERIRERWRQCERRPTRLMEAMGDGTGLRRDWT